MITSIEQYMGLAYILLIIPSKQCSRVLFRGGVSGRCSVSSYDTRANHLPSFTSCMAPSHDLDGNIHPHHDRQHTNMLVEMFELVQLWDEYGLVRDVVVSPTQSLFEP